MAVKCGTHHGTQQWINLEPCGLICGSITWFLLIYAMFTTSFYVIIPWFGFSFQGVAHLLLFNSICIISMYSHLKAMCTDPGAVPKDARPLPDDAEENDYEASYDRQEKFKRYCRKCKGYKPRRAHHCSICGRCIVKMDHHCPWVNNCVGVGNHKLFLLFVFWVFVACSYALILVTAKYFICMVGDHDFCRHDVHHHLLVIFLVIESILFGLFTMCMIGDQWTTISSNQTQIDRLKNTKYEYQEEVNEVCGSPNHVTFSWSWLYPRAVKFTDDLKHRIYGFRVEENEEISPLIHSTDHTVNSGLMVSSARNSKEELDDGSKRLLVRKASGNRKDRSDDESAYGEEDSDWLGEKKGSNPNLRKSLNDHVLTNNSSLRHQNEEEISTSNYVRLEMHALNTHQNSNLASIPPSNHRDEDKDQVLSTSSIASANSGNVTIRKRSALN